MVTDDKPGTILKMHLQPPYYDVPAKDLARSLVIAYFDNLVAAGQAHWAITHKGLRELHLNDGGIYLLEQSGVTCLAE
jgi:hypothetical protein